MFVGDSISTSGISTSGISTSGISTFTNSSC